MDNPVVCLSGLKLLDPFSIHLLLLLRLGVCMYIRV